MSGAGESFHPRDIETYRITFVNVALGVNLSKNNDGRTPYKDTLSILYTNI